jgi:hypothetical protein
MCVRGLECRRTYCLSHGVTCRLTGYGHVAFGSFLPGAIQRAAETQCALTRPTPLRIWFICLPYGINWTYGQLGAYAESRAEVSAVAVGGRVDLTRGSRPPSWVSAMAATKFCRDGMPHRISDGKVCWPDAQYWSDLFRCPWRSGNWLFRHWGQDADLDAEEHRRAYRQRLAERGVRYANRAWMRPRSPIEPTR